MQEAHCNYYGTLMGDRKGWTIGETLLDEMYMKVLAKHEAQLVKDQDALISELKKTFAAEIKEFRKTFASLDIRLCVIEKAAKKAYEIPVVKKEKKENNK